MRKRPRPSNLPPIWYRCEDMCRLFDVSDRTVYRWCAIGKLPKPVKRGRRWSRWLKTEIDAVLAEMGVKGGAA
jgi:predicted DNA-binding transcriptional regulator AlpA